MKNIKKVIVIDESAFIRGKISEFINKTNNFKIINRFRNVKMYVKQIIKSEPDLIILDLNEEEADKLDMIQENILSEIDTNILVIIKSDEKEFLKNSKFENYKNTYFIKNVCDFTIDGIKVIEKELISKIEACINSEHKRNYIDKVNLFNKQHIKKNIDVVLIGASTGGPRALTKVLTSIKRKINRPILIVQHMPTGFTKSFAERLNKSCLNFIVVEAEDGMNIENDKVYIAKGGIHMCISEDKKIIFDDSNSIWGVKPAVDKLFLSASKVYKGNILACILTGMGKDGADGIVKIKELGGTIIAESEKTALIYGMPKAAIETGKVDYILEIEQIGVKIGELLEDNE